MTDPAADPTERAPVMLLSDKILPGLPLPDGTVTPKRRVQRWSNGLISVEYLFTPPPFDPLREAAFKAQLVANDDGIPRRDPWAIPREHDNNLDVAFGVPEFEGVKGTLELALRALLVAKTPDEERIARDELLGVAIGLTLGTLAQRLAEMFGSAAVEDLKDRTAPRSERGRAVCGEIMDTFSRPPDRHDLEKSYEEQTEHGCEFRVRSARQAGRIESVLHETRVPQADPRDDERLADRSVRRDWHHRRTDRPVVALASAHGEVEGGQEPTTVDAGLDFASALNDLGLQSDELRAVVAVVQGFTQTEAAERVWPGSGAAGHKRLSRLLARVRDGLEHLLG
ncbi:MAG TPA: hypothetical protein VFF73_03070 [Planctomycetota bacterium]|nr:hypothetical protein [Planctomycetota bacterium]